MGDILITKSQEESTNRVSFGNRLSVIAVAAGSAIGLGNIWKFPYITGVNGGAAFILVYLACILIVGLPVLMSEFIIGRRGQKNVVGAFKALAGRQSPWLSGGYIALFGSIIVLSFYGVVAGWSLEYICKALTDSFADKSPEEVGHLFGSFISSPYKPVMWQLVFMGLTTWVVCAGVKKGIEIFSNIAMPVLLGLIVLLCIRSLTLPNAADGLAFLFQPDFSKLSTTGFLDALGHAFFTLGLGVGAMVTYGSYINRKEDLGYTALLVVVADTLVALLAGIAIFPAVFSFGVEPGAGPGLVFVTLPNLFARIPGGFFFCILFFMLLTVAALTSSISMLEVGVAYISEDLHTSRVKAALLVSSLISAIGIFCSLSFGPLKAVTLFGKSIFDLADFSVSNLGMPIGGLIAVLFVAWGMKQKALEDELTSGNSIEIGYVRLFTSVAKYITPVTIAIVFLRSLNII